MVNHPNRSKGKPKLYTVKLTLAEINALLGTSGNADARAMAEDFESEEEGDLFLATLQSATDKLNTSK